MLSARDSVLAHDDNSVSLFHDVGAVTELAGYSGSVYSSYVPFINDGTIA